MHPKNEYTWKEMLCEGGSWDNIRSYNERERQYCEEDVKTINDICKTMFAKTWLLYEEKYGEEDIILEDVEYYADDVVLTYSNDAKVHISIYDFENSYEQIKNMDYETVVREYALEVVE